MYEDINNKSKKNFVLGINNVIPQMTMIKTSDKDCVVVGDIITYQIIIQNTGDVLLNNICISDLLPPQLKFIDDSVTIDNNYSSDSIFNCIGLKSLKVGESKTIKFKAEVLYSSTSSIENTSQGTFEYLIPGLDPRKGSSVSNTTKLKIEKVNINIIKESNKSFVVLGDTITYTVKLINNGTLDALGVIFKDNLPSGVELVKQSFKIGSNIVNITQSTLELGVNIGNIETGKTVVIEYTVKVVSPNYLLQLINSASIKFNYRCSDNTIGQSEVKSTDTSSINVDLATTNFKQIIIDDYLNIPDAKPDIEEIDTVSGKINIIKSRVIETSKITSNEGQKLSQYKLIIYGSLGLVIEYTACDVSQSVHSAHYDIPFSTFIILPDNYVLGNKCNLEGVVEDIYYNKVNCRKWFFNSTILINTKIRSC